MHQGRFPHGDEAASLPADLWAVPGGGGLRYQYVPGLSASARPALLAYEPELDPERRLVLLTDGEIATLRSAEVVALRAKEASP